jgi:hypothetical protein
MSGRPRLRALYRLLHTVFPRSRFWAERAGWSTGRFHYRRMQRLHGPDRAIEARQALNWLDLALSKRKWRDREGPTSDHVGYVLKSYIAEAALHVGDTERAGALAGELLRAYEPAHVTSGPRFGELEGDVHFYAHQVLGQIALGRGDIEEAEGHLIASTEAGPSLSVRVNGPDLELAQGLLTEGSSRAVRDFLAACKDLWPAGGKRIEAWIDEIDRGQLPSLLSSD